MGSDSLARNQGLQDTHGHWPWVFHGESLPRMHHHQRRESRWVCCHLCVFVPRSCLRLSKLHRPAPVYAVWLALKSLPHTLPKCNLCALLGCSVFVFMPHEMCDGVSIRCALVLCSICSHSFRSDSFMSFTANLFLSGRSRLGVSRRVFSLQVAIV